MAHILSANYLGDNNFTTVTSNSITLGVNTASGVALPELIERLIELAIERNGERR